MLFFCGAKAPLPEYRRQDFSPASLIILGLGINFARLKPRFLNYSKLSSYVSLSLSFHNASLVPRPLHLIFSKTFTNIQIHKYTDKLTIEVLPPEVKTPLLAKGVKEEKYVCVKLQRELF